MRELATKLLLTGGFEDGLLGRLPARGGSWTKKRAAILKHSALNLNRPLEDYDEWDEAVILDRGNVLFKVAKKIWPQPPSWQPVTGPSGSLKRVQGQLPSR